ncbi:MAG: anhydro-N-acetylmuramic acid kinase, partial [Rhodospirillales bacterium]
VNVGGVANVTWIGAAAGEVLAFDTGPGNALIDDWTRARTGRPMDEDGALAAAGRVFEGPIAAVLGADYFRRPPPKSLDRDAFASTLAVVADLGAADGAATLTALTARAIAAARAFMPAPPRRWLICGGGRHNRTMMTMLAAAVGTAVEPVEAAGWDGDALEAQAFAFLAVRSVLGLPLSLPSTTGVRAPQTGGVLRRPG